MDRVDLSFLAAIVALLIIASAYVYAYVARPKAFRPLHVISLCCTALALFQMLVLLYSDGGRLNAQYAMIFLSLAGLAQAALAVRSRPDRRT